MAKRHAIILSSEEQRRRLTAVKSLGQHLGKTGRGLMIEDSDVVELIAELAARLGVSKREAVKQSLRLLQK